MSTPLVAAIHDLSGFGRCSLTVAIPILSAMGVQCCPLPTAYLSAHTGFDHFTFKDMTDEIPAVTDHWNALDLPFRAVYTGFLGSARQIQLVQDAIERFRRPDTVVVVDPVMADDGVIYQTYTEEMCQGMAHLAASADVITPNLTEASLLLNVSYETLAMNETGYRNVVEQLSQNGTRSVVLTGVSLQPNQIGAMCFDAKTSSVFAVQTEKIGHTFYGTGDVFASVLTGALVRGKSLQVAAQQAADFVCASVKRTHAQNLPLREGVDFEPLLGLLTGNGCD